MVALGTGREIEPGTPVDVAGRQRRHWHSLALAGLALLAGTAVLEAGLRFITVFPIHGAMANRVPDARLGYRLSPRLKDVDPQGFRNSLRPAAVDIVAIGDSMTYGFNSREDESWPKRLGSLCGASAYNMGVPGYGVYQYRALVPDALALGPRVLVLALYPINDALDLCGSQAWVRDHRYWEETTGLPWSSCGKHGSAREARGPLLRWASERSAAVSAIRFLWGQILETRERRSSGPGRTVVGGPNGERLVFSENTQKARARAVDLSAPEVALGVEQLKVLLVDTEQRCKGAGVRLVVLAFPSRERVVDGLVTPAVDMDGYRALLRSEAAVVNRLAEAARQRHTIFIDLGHVLRAAMKAGVRVFPDGEDDHPVPAGYDVVADTVRDHVCDIVQ